MKIRIGFGLGTRTLTNSYETFDPFLDALEGLGFDSLWLSERIGGECPDPVVGMAYAAGRTKRIKFGTSVMVLPGRNPALLAKELASLDRLSGGRLLPAFGLGIRDPHEQMAFGVERRERAAIFDEVLPLLRRIWAEDSVDHEGERFKYTGLRVEPKPTQTPMDVWLGGASPAELRRVGRLGDGWLPSFCTPQMAADGWHAICEEAAKHDRQIEDEHFGVLVPYSHGEITEPMRQILQKRAPDADPTDVIPVGWDGLRVQLERFIEVGASKFVPILVGEPDNWTAELEGVASAVLSLHN
jgi:probable F420-dependent oxidoreductase